MTAQLIDGTAVAERIRTEIAADAARFKATYGYAPGLGVVLVGDDPASQMYVRMKRKACEKVGIESKAHLLPSTATQEEVEAAVQSLNDDPAIHGILVQLPMPKHIDEERVLRCIDLSKDVDGIHPLNVGLLAMKGRSPLFTAATPTGCMILLKEAGINLDGANAVVLGRSNIVGMPVSLMLMKANATVTVCHSRTRNLAEVVRGADVLIAAIGKPEYVQAEWVKPGAAVIDVGSNKVDDPATDKGYRYVGDVDYERVKEVAGYITAVPGGVGPMTITVLLLNTMKAAQHIAQATTM